MRKTIFKIKAGSYLYGLNDEKSDLDYFSVFIPDVKDILGINKVKQVDNSTNKSNTKNTSEDVDDVAYSLPRFLELLLGSNPNIIESLYSKEFEIIEPEFQWLIDNRDKIASKKVFKTFTGYASGQKKKLVVKAARYNSISKAIKWIEKEHSEYIEGYYTLSSRDADTLNSIIKYYKGAKQNCESFHTGLELEMVYTKLIAERDAYGHRVKTETFTNLGLDVKFAYHLVRILGEAEMFLRDGEINYPIKGVLKEEIMAIKNGERNLQEIIEMADYYEGRAGYFLGTTGLREKPDWNFVNDWLIDTMTKHIKEN